MRGISRLKCQKAIFFGATSFFWFSLYIYIPFQTTYLLVLGYSSILVGSIVGAYGFTQLVLRIPLGISADLRGKHKPIMATGCILAAIASLFRIILPNDAGFLIGGLISGAGASTWISFVIFHSSLYPKEDQQKANSLSIAANNTGVLAAFLLGLLCYDELGMGFLCLLSVAAGIFSFLLCLLIKEPVLEQRQSIPVRELITVFKNKRMLVFALLSLVQQGIVLTTAMSFTTQHIQKLGADGTQIGICSIIYILVGVVSAFFCSSKLFIRLGGKRLIPAVHIGLTAYCILLPLTVSVWQVYLAQILAGLSQGISFSLCNGESVAEIPPGKRSTAMGVFQAIYALGMTTFPILCGKISSSYSMATSYYFLAVLCAGSVLLSLWFYFWKKQPEG